MANQYIGLGFIFEYLTKTWLKEKFSIMESEILDKSRKIDFIVEAEGMDRKKAKIGIQLTTNPNDMKLEYFLKSRYEILHNVDKAVYLQMDLTVADNEKRPESSLITFILENIAAVIRREINGNNSLQAYRISIYDFDKIPINIPTDSSQNIVVETPSVPLLVAATPASNNAVPTNTIVAKIIKKGGLGRPIIVQGPFETHIGRIDDDCVDRNDIFNYLNGEEASIIDKYLLIRPLKVNVRMEKNYMEGKSDIARIISIVK